MRERFERPTGAAGWQVRGFRSSPEKGTQKRSGVSLWKKERNASSDTEIQSYCRLQYSPCRLIYARV